MNVQRLLACSFLVVLSACSAECSCGGNNDDDDTTSTGQGGDGPTTTGVGGEGGQGEGGSAGGTGEGGEGGGAPEGDVQLRILHLSPDSAAYNVCLVTDDEEIGPLFDADGIEFEAYSERIPVFSGTYDVVVTAPGAADCGTAIARLDDQILGENSAHSLAIMGLADAIEVNRFEDDLSEPAAGAMHARFIHAAFNAPAVDVGYVDGDDAFQPLWENVEYGTDAGYIPIEAFDTLELEARAAGTDTVLLGGIEVTGEEGSIVEGIATGSVQTGVGVLTITTAAE